MVAYLDSSVVLRHILLADPAIHHAFACDRVVTSELLEIECRRVLQRYRLNGELDDDRLVQAVERLQAVLAGVWILALSPAVKTRAMGSYPVVVKTLDALHLASAQTFAEYHLRRETEEQLLMFSYDASLNRCARALNLPTPLAGS